MRFKRGALLVLFCLGAAVTMAVTGDGGAGNDNSSSEVVVALVKSPSQPGHQAGATERPQTDATFDLGSIRHGGSRKIQTSSLFQSKSWYTPPPPPPPTQASLLPPPPPAPPQFPYTYIGKMVDGNDVALFLLKNDREYTVRVNDVLDDTYRVDKITDKEAVLTYIPLNTQQTLTLNSAMETNSTINTAMTNPQIPQSLPPQLNQTTNVTQLIK